MTKSNQNLVKVDIFNVSRHQQTLTGTIAVAKMPELCKFLANEEGEFEDIVISCGGSTPLFFDNMDYMLGQGETIYLNATTDTLTRRLKQARMKRPLIAQKSDSELEQYVESEIKRREPGYLRAKHICRADYLESVDQISDTIKEVKKLLTIE